eukprot:900781-Alexandrium_andersonii.AAC.1
MLGHACVRCARLRLGVAVWGQGGAYRRALRQPIITMATLGGPGPPKRCRVDRGTDRGADAFPWPQRPARSLADAMAWASHG